MSIYPNDISTRDFLVVPEGYDRDEVRTFLQVLAREQQVLRDEIETLRAEMTPDGDPGAEVATVLLAAKSAAEEAVRLAVKEADELRGRAQDDSDRLREATVAASEKTREEADREAARARDLAERDARQTLDDATERVERLLDGAAKVRDRLFGLDAILGSVRSEVAQAAGALDDVERPVSEAPVTVDLREVSAG
jgi:cell division septum initiation protein DivIVA